MDKVPCDRTIRRQAATRAEQILSTTIVQHGGPEYMDGELSADDQQPATNHEEGSSSPYHYVYHQEHIQEDVSESDDGFEIDIQSEVLGEHENDIAMIGDTFSSDDDVTDDDISDDEELEKPDFSEELRQWILQSGTPLCHTNSLLGILRPHFPFLPKDGRTLLHTCRTYDIEELAGGKYHHFGIAEGIKGRLLREEHLRTLSEVSLQVNIDGMPLFKSSNESFWPILGLLQQEEQPEPFVIGLWVGTSKPNDSNAFMSNFIDEMKEIEVNGVTYADKAYKVTIANFVCDTPARSFVKKTKGHTGYFACDNCVQRGVWTNHRMTFPERNAAPRTDVSFDEMRCEEHHKGETSLKQLNIGLVSQFPLDYMHLICLGIVKKLISIWMCGPLNGRLGNNVIQLISDSVLNLKPCLPREFLRKGRPLMEVDRWKATEFRTFLLYTGPVALKGKVSEVLYSNFMMLSVGITILSSIKLCSLYCDYVEDLLGMFVDHFGALYGPEQVVYNVHGLTHLASHARRFGPLHGFSAFPFENYLQVIKKLVRKPKFPLEQVIRRLHEKMHVIKRRGPQRTFCKKEHYQGPLPRNVAVCSQYEEIHLPHFVLSTKRPDNAVLNDNNTYIIKNIIIYDDLRRLVCQKFTSRESFFTYPLDSCRLNISLVSNLEEHTVELDPSLISGKVVLLPFNDAFISFPLLQSS